MQYVVYFLIWTLWLYWLHRLFHLSAFHFFHYKHHMNVQGKWSWKNLFLFIDDWEQTIDQWLTEVIPTIIFSAISGQWWLCVFYWVWAAIIQEAVEHNERISLYPFLTSGRWHIHHHKNDKTNYGLFFPIWDILFKTNQKV